MECKKVGSKDICIFCLELLNCINCIGKIHENETEIKLLNVINKNINLKCNHDFHIDCFFLYKKNNKENNTLPCPLFRYNL